MDTNAEVRKKTTEEIQKDLQKAIKLSWWPFILCAVGIGSFILASALEFPTARGSFYVFCLSLGLLLAFFGWIPSLILAGRAKKLVKEAKEMELEGAQAAYTRAVIAKVCALVHLVLVLAFISRLSMLRA